MQLSQCRPPSVNLFFPLGFSHILHLLVKYPCEQFTHSAKRIKSPVRATPGSEKHRHENTTELMDWLLPSSYRRQEWDEPYVLVFFLIQVCRGKSLRPYLTRNLWLTARPHNTLTLRVQTEGGGRRWAGERERGESVDEPTSIHVCLVLFGWILPTPFVRVRACAHTCQT